MHEFDFQAKDCIKSAGFVCLAIDKLVSLARTTEYGAVMKRIASVIAIGWFLCFWSGYATAQSNLASPLGTNLAPVTYNSTEQPFLNIFKTGGGWDTYNSSNQDTNEEVLLYQQFLDANGYPTTLTGGPAHNFTQVATLVLRSLGDSSPNQYYPAGDYLLQWSGTGAFGYHWDANGTCSTSPCRIAISSPSDAGVLIILTSTGSGSNYAKNISLIYCGTWNGSSCSNGYDKLLANGEMFNPSFIAAIRPFKTLRFMDWMATEGNFQTNWSDRPLPNWAFWDDSRTNATINGADPRPSNGAGINDGVPAEVMFALCNEVNADCWFNMPPLATDDYVTQFATLAHAQLNSNSKAYVEYANEVWNSHFAPQQSGNVSTGPLNNESVWQQLIDRGLATYPGFGTNTYGAAFAYGEALRPVQVGHDWKVAWGSDAGRVIRIAAGQNAWTYGRNDWILSSLPNGTVGCCGQGSMGGPTYWYGTTAGAVAQNVDAFAVAPYFGDSYNVPDNFSLDQLFTEIMSGGLVSGGYPGGMIAETLKFAAQNYSIAQQYGPIPLVAYEGGQGFSAGADSALGALYSAANLDPRMATAYAALFNGWKSLGGTIFNHYTDIGQQSPWGYWGALENVMETSSVKYNALLNFISNNPCWWSGCTSSIQPATQTAAAPTPPSVPANLVGSVASPTQINLSWTASTDSAGVAGYNVFRNGSKIGTTANPSYQDTGLSVGTSYTYAVSAYDTAGNTSAQSATVSVSTPTPPSVAMSSPRNGTMFKAGSLSVASSASDASGIASITISVDSNPFLTCSNATSCSTALQATSLPRGTHVISATASDQWGLTASASASVLFLQ